MSLDNLKHKAFLDWVEDFSKTNTEYTRFKRRFTTDKNLKLGLGVIKAGYKTITGNECDFYAMQTILSTIIDFKKKEIDKFITDFNKSENKTVDDYDTFAYNLNIITEDMILINLHKDLLDKQYRKHHINTQNRRY